MTLHRAPCAPVLPYTPVRLSLTVEMYCSRPLNLSDFSPIVATKAYLGAYRLPVCRVIRTLAICSRTTCYILSTIAYHHMMEDSGVSCYGLIWWLLQCRSMTRSPGCYKVLCLSHKLVHSRATYPWVFHISFILELTKRYFLALDKLLVTERSRSTKKFQTFTESCTSACESKMCRPKVSFGDHEAKAPWESKRYIWKAGTVSLGTLCSRFWDAEQVIYPGLHLLRPKPGPRARAFVSGRTRNRTVYRSSYILSRNVPVD